MNFYYSTYSRSKIFIIVSFNSNGAKRNLSFIHYICSFDILFICETWLLLKESQDLLDNL